MPDTTSLRDAFIRAAVAPRNTSHASGALTEANTFLADDPALATRDIHVAAVLGDSATVRTFLRADPALATAKAGPYDWDALTHLCFSRFLRLDAARSDGFVDAARALLDAGASANTGFFEAEHQPKPEWEPVLYGAAGIAHHEALTRLLLERGANPNDGEVSYHAPEGYDLGAFKALLASPLLNAESLCTMLLRKSDWHDIDGMRLTLDRGADANSFGSWDSTPLRHAIRSDNGKAIVALLLDRGADPLLAHSGKTPVAMAAWAGRNDLLALFAEHGATQDTLTGLDALLAACATSDTARIDALTREEPALKSALLENGALPMVRFAGVGNLHGITQLLDLGVPVNIAEPNGEGYLERARDSTALHVAAWRARHDVVKLLLAHGANVDARNAADQSPLMLAVRANVDSYWVDEQSTESIAALLNAGASVRGVRLPTGYADADELLRARGREDQQR